MDAENPVIAPPTVLVVDDEKNIRRTLDMVLSGEWTRPYSREQAAFPAPWSWERKFWPHVGRVDNAYGDKNLVCACPPLESYSS